MGRASRWTHLLEKHQHSEAAERGVVGAVLVEGR